MHLLCSLKGPLQKLSSPNLLGIPQPWSIRELKQQRYSGYRSFFSRVRRGAFAGCGPAADTSSAEGRRNERQRKRHQKSEFALFQTSLPLFQLFYFVKCWRFFQELKSKGLYLSSQKKKKTPGCLVFTSSTEREIRKFHV